ncbi:MAG: Crp/Fnr family transcriptional regulator [Bacilli bacterium]|nr:Crp/Fnr family transcriptional regulator [Bacilli bacterium]
MEDTLTFFKSSFPLWNEFKQNTQDKLLNNGIFIHYKKDELISGGKKSCLGLIIVKKGIIRAYLASESGKQITLYKLFPNDICVFSASCLMKNITFDIELSADKDSDIFLIETKLYEQLIKEDNILANYINDILTSRFSDTMWVFEQFVFQSLDKRLAAYLLEQETNNNVIDITHEKIAKDLGSAREVISRLLKMFEKEKLIKLSRNKITILNEKEIYKIMQ